MISSKLLRPAASVLSVAALTLVHRAAVSRVERMERGFGAPQRREGIIDLDVRDADTNQPIPFKLSFVGVGATGTPRFADDVGLHVQKGILAYSSYMSLTGTAQVHVPEGTYDVYVSRGLEWDLYVEHGLRVGARPMPLVARLHHVVDTRGWISADFHVHSNASVDSRVPLANRVYEFVSDGVEFMVATDHNWVSDYSPLIRSLGAGRWVASASGDELSTKRQGHVGVFPLVPDARQPLNGGFAVRGRTIARLLHDVRQREPEALVTLNHPRINTRLGYFSASGYDAAADRADFPSFSLDFDAIEVLNGYHDTQRRAFERTLSDWFELIEHGHRLIGVGNSDTHHLKGTLGGYPRNFVAVADDEPEHASGALIADAVRAGRVFFTTGPFVRVEARGHTFGETISVPSGRVTAHIVVEAAPWIDVDTVTAYVNGKVARVLDAKGTGVVRLDANLPLELEHDGWLVVRVDGNRPLWPIAGDLYATRVLPLAVTNPIYFEVDGSRRLALRLRPTPARVGIQPRTNERPGTN